jgi:hypothetical protein
MTLEDSLDHIEKRPGAAVMEAAFDFDAEYAKFRADLIKGRAECGDMVYMPAQWDAGAELEWYNDCVARISSLPCTRRFWKIDRGLEILRPENCHIKKR